MVLSFHLPDPRGRGRERGGTDGDATRIEGRRRRSSKVISSPAAPGPGVDWSESDPGEILISWQQQRDPTAEKASLLLPLPLCV